MMKRNILIISVLSICILFIGYYFFSPFQNQQEKIENFILQHSPVSFNYSLGCDSVNYTDNEKITLKFSTLDYCSVGCCEISPFFVKHKETVSINVINMTKQSIIIPYFKDIKEPDISNISSDLNTLNEYHKYLSEPKCINRELILEKLQEGHKILILMKNCTGLECYENCRRRCYMDCNNECETLMLECYENCVGSGKSRRECQEGCLTKKDEYDICKTDCEKNVSYCYRDCTSSSDCSVECNYVSDSYIFHKDSKWVWIEKIESHFGDSSFGEETNEMIELCKKDNYSEEEKQIIKELCALFDKHEGKSIKICGTTSFGG